MDQQIKVSGCVTFWSLSEWHSRDHLKQELEICGLDKFIPPARGPLQALRDSLGEVFPRHRIEYTLGKKFYQVDKIERKADEVLYQKVCLASIDKHGSITIDPFHWEIADEITKSFNKHLGLVPASAVAESLIRYCDYLGGTRLRPVGGIYWLPEEKLANWQQMVKVVQEAAVGTSVCYLIRHQMDHDAARAIKDAICAEMKSEATKIKQEIQSGELSDRQLENRHNYAEDLRAKIQVYEEILGQSLHHLHEALEDAEHAAAMGGILESVAGLVPEEAHGILA